MLLCTHEIVHLYIAISRSQGPRAIYSLIIKLEIDIVIYDTFSDSSNRNTRYFGKKITFTLYVYDILPRFHSKSQ